MNDAHLAVIALKMLVLSAIGSLGIAVVLTVSLAHSEFGTSAFDAFILLFGACAPAVILLGAPQAAVGASVAGFILILMPLSLTVQHEGRELLGQWDWFAGAGLYLLVTAVCGIDLIWRWRRMAA